MNTINYKDAANIVEKTLTRLVNEGIIESDIQQEPEENEPEYHFIWENNEAALIILNDIAGKYTSFMSCDIERDKYSAYVDLDDVIVIVGMDDNGYLYVSKVESYATDGKQQSTKLWLEVGDCINKINACKIRPCDIENTNTGY